MLRAAFVPPEEAVEELRALAGRFGFLPGVHPLPLDQLDIRIARLGNLHAADAVKLADRFQEWPGVDVLPEVRWSGVHLEPNGDVGVGLAGDLDRLAEVARAVGLSAEKVNVYVDRRAFVPVAIAATMDEQRPGSRVGSALAGMSDVGGTPWTMSEVALIRIRWFAGQEASEVVERIPIPVLEPIVEREAV
ncbi:2'-5' RNA ligase family protein [Nocardioides sp. CPCC 206347]|uniref:2'-5' RNA ligase family protein n=1 Tax=unclassified Nocardioides TaxID=2615069 RepID=UPI00367211DA